MRVRSHPGRSLRLDTAFHSPAAKSCLAANPRGRVDAPGLHLRHHTGTSLGPFGSPLPALPGVFLPGRARSLRIARCQLTIPASSVYRRAAAPLQDLSILRDLCALPDCIRKSLPSRVARSAFAPRRPAIMNYHFATDQRSSSASSRLARCPSCLLEPRPSCACPGRASSENVIFPPLIFTVFSVS